MKKIIALLFIMFIGFSVAAQKKEKTYAAQDKTAYLEKSRNNKTLGWVLLGAGTAMTIGGAIGVNDNGVLSSSSDSYYVLTTFGVLSMLGSIPAFIISSNQANKAAGLSIQLKKESKINIHSTHLASNYFPAVGIKYSF